MGAEHFQQIQEALSPEAKLQSGSLTNLAGVVQGFHSTVYDRCCPTNYLTSGRSVSLTSSAAVKYKRGLSNLSSSCFAQAPTLRLQGPTVCNAG